jgi:hypothetical protein
MRLKRPALDNITSREIFDRVKFRTKFQVIQTNVEII